MIDGKRGKKLHREEKVPNKNVRSYGKEVRGGPKRVKDRRKKQCSVWEEGRGTLAHGRKDVNVETCRSEIPPPPHFPRVGGFLHSFDSAEDSFTPKIQGSLGRNVESRTETRELTQFRILNRRERLCCITYHCH
jgi:hypothetical protein